MKEPSLPTVKNLFAVSANRCAFPSCPLPLVDPPSQKVTGRVCHIKAASPKGPRYDPNQTSEERHSFENLILMCPLHHDVIDADVVAYTVERLQRMKWDHETASGEGPEPPNAVATALIANSHLYLAAGSVLLALNQSGGQMAHSITNVFGHASDQNALAVSKVRERRAEVHAELWQRLLEAQGPCFQVAAGLLRVPDLNSVSYDRFVDLLEESTDLTKLEKLELLQSKNRNSAFQEIIRRHLTATAREKWRELHNYANASRPYLSAELKEATAAASSAMSRIIVHSETAKAIADIDYVKTDRLAREMEMQIRKIETMVTIELGGT